MQKLETMKRGDTIEIREEWRDTPDEDTRYIVKEISGNRLFAVGLVDMNILPVELFTVDMVRVVKNL